MNLISFQFVQRLVWVRSVEEEEGKVENKENEEQEDEEVKWVVRWCTSCRTGSFHSVRIFSCQSDKC